MLPAHAMALMLASSIPSSSVSSSAVGGIIQLAEQPSVTSVEDFIQLFNLPKGKINTLPGVPSGEYSDYVGVSGNTGVIADVTVRQHFYEGRPLWESFEIEVAPKVCISAESIRGRTSVPVKTFLEATTTHFANGLGLEGAEVALFSFRPDGGSELRVNALGCSQHIYLRKTF